jgi:hypothetical protein
VAAGRQHVCRDLREAQIRQFELKVPAQQLHMWRLVRHSWRRKQ